MTNETEEKKPDLADTVTQIAQALEKEKQHFVIRTDTKVIGAFLPSEQAEWFTYVKGRMDSMDRRLEVLEGSDPSKESDPAVSLDQKDSHE